MMRILVRSLLPRLLIDDPVVSEPARPFSTPGFAPRRKPDMHSAVMPPSAPEHLRHACPVSGNLFVRKEIGLPCGEPFAEQVRTRPHLRGGT